MIRALASFLRDFSADRRGNVAILAAISMPVLVGSLGLGAEVASWHGGKRALQNAADSAAIAAATNATSSYYQQEARAVAARYGFKDGVDGVSVTAAENVTCPNGKPVCYSVVITRAQPLMLTQAVGFKGDADIDGVPAKLISAKAVAIQSNGPREYCLLALASSGDPEALRTNGAPKANLKGCGVMSNTAATCNGHDLQADYGDAHNTNNGCGVVRKSNVASVADPYSKLVSNIPADKCSTYPTAPAKKKDPPLPSTNLLQGLENRNVIDVCGDVQLTGPTLVNSTGDGTVLIVRNGSLDLNGYKLSTIGSGGLTVIFTGNSSGRLHKPVGDGEFDFAAPTSGPWKGVAMYQDPRMGSGSNVNVDYAGNKPTWNMTGLVYLPRASVKFSGAVNKASNGYACFGMVMDNVTINGTAEIANHGECAKAGLTLPYSEAPARGELVS